jgi:hypothetical protein
MFCAGRLFGQVFETAAGRVDLENDAHRSGYLQNITVSHDKIKIIWYPGLQLYRPCGVYTAPKPVLVGYRYVNVICQCDDKFAYRLAPTAGAGAGYSDIQFEFDSSVLKTSSHPVLDATSADLRLTGSTVVVAGYASSEGTAAHNMSLSRDRANSVKTYLVNSGVEANKVKVKAYGETNPIADNSAEEGRVANRRVEFKKE